MAWSGAGTFLELTPPEFPAVAGDDIIAEYFNSVIRDILDGFSNVVTRDGQSPATANLPMGGFKHTGVGVATGNGQYAEYSQVIGLGAAIGVLPVLRKSAAYTIVPADVGYNITHPPTDATARIWTVQANATSAWPDGAAVTVSNKNGAGVITITPTDTMYLAGTGATGNRTLAANGVATMLWDATSATWLISGNGLT